MVKVAEILRPSKVEYANYAINHVRGCAHGCSYCFARKMAKRFGWIKTNAEWHRRPQIVENTLELLDKEIPKKKHKIENVHLSFMTDPFMVGYPKVEELSLTIIERLHNAEIPVQTLTKGVTPRALMDGDTYGYDNYYGATIVSFDYKFYERWEPYAAQPMDRLLALRELHKAGFKTWVSIEPYPTPNKFNQDIDNVLWMLGFVDRIVFGKWNYSKTVNEFTCKQAYYDYCACRVIEFGKEKGIDVHIKKGTVKDA